MAVPANIPARAECGLGLTVRCVMIVRMNQLTNRPAPQSKAPTPPPFRIPWRDRWTIIINGVFALLGLLLIRANLDVGIVTVAFFGSGAFLLAWLQWRKYVEHRQTLTSVDVVGGVRIYPRRAFMLVMGGWLAALGLVLFVFGTSYPGLLRWIAAFIFVCGFVLCVLTVLRQYPPGFLQFEPDGLMIGRRGWQVRVPWDCIYAVETGEISNNPIIQLGVTDRHMLVVSPATAQSIADKAMKGGSLTDWGPFIIFPMHYGVASKVLAGAIMHYVEDAAARRSLGKRQLASPEHTHE